MALIIFFAIGVVEMFIVTAWTKVVIGAQVLLSGAITFVNVLIWYFILEAIVSNIENLPLILTYAVGCALGTMLGTAYISHAPRPKQKMTAQTSYESHISLEHGPAHIV